MIERFLTGFNLFYEESLTKISREHVLTDLQHHEQHCKDERLESVHRAGALGALIWPGDTDLIRRGNHSRDSPRARRPDSRIRLGATSKRMDTTPHRKRVWWKHIGPSVKMTKTDETFCKTVHPIL